MTISQSAKAVLATLCWTAAVTLLLATTFGGLPDVCGCWAVVCGLWGTVFIGWALIVRERLALERLADIMAAELTREDARIHQLH